MAGASSRTVSDGCIPVTNGDKVYCPCVAECAGLFQITENNQAEELWFQPNKLMNHWSTPSFMMAISTESMSSRNMDAQHRRSALTSPPVKSNGHIRGLDPVT